MRKLIYFVACTIDRFIAREDGSFDYAFLMEGEHITDQIESFPETIPAPMREAAGITGSNQWFDAVLMGRRTYEVGLKAGLTNPYPHLKQYVFSHSLGVSPDAAVELVSGDPLEKVRELKQGSEKAIWLCGGGELAAALFPEIDELILKVHPVLLGTGIPLFAGVIKQTALELTDHRIYNTGVMRLHYRVRHSP
jgi:dihydrofolate reductase